jgi:peptidoglycan L-alanyl-D-glutamate endopeptidase CwlK
MEKDNITLERIKLIHPKLQSELLSIYNDLFDKGVYIRFTSTFRSFLEQDAIYYQGRKSLEEVNNMRLKCGLYLISEKENKIVSNAFGGRSYHNYGIAVDFCLLSKNHNYDMEFDTNNNNEKDWNEVVKVFKNYGWDWGSEVNFKSDTPHFQKTFGYKINQLLEKYNRQDFIIGTEYLNL